MLGSRSDSSGFRLAWGGRTAVRILGTFVPQPGGGTVVEYRIELIPIAVASFAIALPMSIFVLALLFWLSHESLLELWWLGPIVIFVVAVNLWLSERQARGLVRFVEDRLEAL
jgi:hypothetical protein